MSALSDPPTMAFLCRSDLQLSPGKLAVQCAHAAVESLQRAKKTHSRMVQRWKEGSSRKICLPVDDETELEYFLGQVQEASLPFALIRDARLFVCISPYGRRESRSKHLAVAFPPWTCANSLGFLGEDNG